MGIKSNFTSFLRKMCPSAFVPVHLSTFAYEKIAIDISLYMHKYKSICGERWPSAFINLIASLRRNEIHCVFIFDGKAPDEKSTEHEKRKNNKENNAKKILQLDQAFEQYKKTGVISSVIREMYARRRSPVHAKLLRKGSNSDNDIDMDWVEKKINQKKNSLYEVLASDFDLAKTLFKMLGVPWYTSPSEAEKQCSKLCIDGTVHAVLTEDSDVLAYGAPILLTKIDTSADTCVAIYHDIVLEELDLDNDQFLDLCILCGTDYNENIKGIGSKRAYDDIIRVYGSIDEYADQTGKDVSILNHHRTRELFRTFDEEENAIGKIPYCSQPNYEKFQQFLVDRGFNLNFAKLKNAFIHAEIEVVQDDDE